MKNWRQDDTVLNKGIIILRALNKKSAPAKLCPLPEKGSGKIFTGQGYLTQQQKENLPLVVDGNTVMTIRDGFRLDLSDPIDRINWAWARRHCYIEFSREMASANPDARYYVENKEKEAEAFVSTESDIVEAKYKAMKATNAQKLELCAIFGQVNTDHLTRQEIDKFLLDKAAIFPNQVKAYFDPKKKANTQLDLEIAHMRSTGVIFRAASGYFKYGDAGNPKEAINLGRTEDKVKEFLSSEDNHAIVEEMRMALKEKETQDKDAQ